MNRKMLVLACLPGIAAAAWLIRQRRRQIDDLPQFRMVEEDTLYAGGDPTDAGIRMLASRGIRCVINLEHGFFRKSPAKVKEEKQQVEQLGLHFVHVPMHRYWGPSLLELEEAVHEISLPANQPVYVHCNHGKERTSIVVGTWRVWIRGWPPAHAYAEMKQAGFKGIYRFWWNRFFSTWPSGRQGVTNSL